MFSSILSGTVYGIESYLIRVEVDLSSGLPCFIMVGSPGGEVRESGERVRIALKNMGISIPPMHISVNLSPADLRKEGTGFDLPIALGLLIAMGRLPPDCAEGLLVLGELGLSGEIKRVRGVLPVAAGAAREGVRRALVPEGNVGEAAAAIEATGVCSLAQAVEYLRLSQEEQRKMLPALRVSPGDALSAGKSSAGVDFCEIAGQESAKRGALIAAAGFHHLLLTGPPGSGKTMIARRIPTILPPLSPEESLEVSSIYSIAGRLGEGLITERPFMSPHHTVSPPALTGGGRIPRPGVVSLAHRGVLFLDELPEFGRQTLDLLRQPLEDRKIQIARSSGSFIYPADLMLVAAMNPCPCGYYPDKNRCRCSPYERHHYLSHISGPILDRLDLCIQVSGVDFSLLRQRGEGESSADMREKVMRARRIQEERYKGTDIRFNSRLGVRDLEKYCVLEKREEKMLEKLFSAMQLSARSCHRLLKVARTIADLEESDRVLERHLAEAACCRTWQQS